MAFFVAKSFDHSQKQKNSRKHLKFLVSDREGSRQTSEYNRVISGRRAKATKDGGQKWDRGKPINQ